MLIIALQDGSNSQNKEADSLEWTLICMVLGNEQILLAVS